MTDELAHIEHMTANQFQTLSQREKDRYATQLRRRWKLPITEVLDFWFRDGQIVGVTRLLQRDGGPYLDESGDTAVEVLGEHL
jgi:hypothetical protein